jgi:fermentation-respiration switch protein FrsA (DUF1100 family)
MPPPPRTSALELFAVERVPPLDQIEEVMLRTSEGTIACRLQPAHTGSAAVLWVFGAGGGFQGPAGGLYPRLGEQLVPTGIASLQVAFRLPGDYVNCVYDVLLGIAFLESLGRPRIVLVGHSFGGAVVITAGTVAESAVAVAALSSQTFGTDEVPQLSPRPLLLLHGGDDEILPAHCSQDIYMRAREPKELRIYPGARHGLDECRAELDRDLQEWIQRVVALAASTPNIPLRKRKPR